MIYQFVSNKIENCGNCRLISFIGGNPIIAVCPFNNKKLEFADINKQKPTWCPLKEVKND